MTVIVLGTNKITQQKKRFLFNIGPIYFSTLVKEAKCFAWRQERMISTQVDRSGYNDQQAYAHVQYL